MNRKEKWFLVFVCLTIFVHRSFILAHSRLTFYSDDAIYASLARFFYEGNFAKAFHPTWPPLYPLLSSLTFLLIGSWEKALQLTSVIACALTPVPLYLIGRHFFGQKVLAIFTFTLPFASMFVDYSLQPLSDMLATLLILFCFAFTLELINKPSFKNAVFSGVFFGLTFLTRSEGYLLFLATLIFLTLVSVTYLIKRRPPKTLVVSIGVLIASFFVVASPYLIATRVQLDRWSLSHKFAAQMKQWRAFEIKKGDRVWSQEIVSIKEPKYSSDFFVGGAEHVLEYSDWFAWWFLQKARTWSGVFVKFFPPFAWPFMLLGILRIFTRKHGKKLAYLAILLATAIPLTIFGTPLADIRYLLWTIPIFALFSLLGVTTIFKSHLLQIVFGLALLMSLFEVENLVRPKAFANSFSDNHERPEIVLAGEWVAKNSSGNEPRVLMRHEGVEFYSDGITVYTPEGLPIPEVINYSKDNKVEFVVAWSDELHGDNNLSPLLAGGNDRGLDLEQSFSLEGRTLLIYGLD